MLEQSKIKMDNYNRVSNLASDGWREAAASANSSELNRLYVDFLRRTNQDIQAQKIKQKTYQKILQGAVDSQTPISVL